MHIIREQFNRARAQPRWRRRQEIDYGRGFTFKFMTLYYNIMLGVCVLYMYTRQENSLVATRGGNREVYFFVSRSASCISPTLGDLSASISDARRRVIPISGGHPSDKYNHLKITSRRQSRCWRGCLDSMLFSSSSFKPSLAPMSRHLFAARERSWTTACRSSIVRIVSIVARKR